MKPVKWKILKEENEKKEKIISGNIGIVSCFILILSTMKDILSIFGGQYLQNIAIGVGISGLLILAICTKRNVSTYISNQKNLNGVIEVFTFISIVNFIIGNIFFYSIDRKDVHYGIALSSVLVIMGIGYAWWTFGFRKDRKRKED